MTTPNPQTPSKTQTTANTSASNPNSHYASLFGIAALAALAVVLCDLLHEIGHLAATALPLGVKPVLLSSIGLSSTGSSPLVAAAGPLVNLGLSVFALLVRAVRLSPSWRYFAWIFGTFNAFNFSAYFLYSAILGSGDWAGVWGGITSPLVWRPACAVVGLVWYGAAVYASRQALLRLVAAGVVSQVNVERYCASSYGTGGVLLTVAAAFNPISPWFILTSGAATGFGAMAGLLLLPSLLHRAAPPISIAQKTTPTNESLHVERPWVVAGVAAAIIFIAVFGPGVHFK